MRACIMLYANVDAQCDKTGQGRWSKSPCRRQLAATADCYPLPRRPYTDSYDAMITVSVHNRRTIRYDTRCYFNVRSKADISQLNLQHGNNK